MVGLAGTGLDRIFSGDLDLGGRRYNFFIGEDTDGGATTVILGGFSVGPIGSVLYTG